LSVNVIKRRVQKLGGSSLIVTLPKSWAKKLGLDVGDTLVIVDEGSHLKIFPPDSSMIQVAETIRLKVPQHLLETGLTHLIECLYVKGYKRFIAQLPQSESSETVLKLIEEAKRNPKVRNVNVGFNEIVVSFDGVEAENPLRFIKQYNTKIQELMDVVEQAKVRPVNPDVIERFIVETVDLAKTIGRTLRKHGLTICEADSVDPSVAAPLVMIPQMLEHVYRELLKLDETPAFGGLSNKSSRRIAMAMRQAEELRVEAENTIASKPELSKLAGLIVGITLMVKNIGESTICENLSRE
jgi:bifunctional DNA-binding transcriptional regulator/antitoxin component of YhaV-PrlF toxin-antitoxin module